MSGLRSSSIVSLILQDCEKKSFDECVEAAKLFEQISEEAQIMGQEPVNSYRVTPDRESYTSSVPSNYICIRCGTKARHYARNCFAINMDCRKCSKKGHIAKVCKSKSLAANQGKPIGESASAHYNVALRPSDERENYEIGQNNEPLQHQSNVIYPGNSEIRYQSQDFDFFLG